MSTISGAKLKFHRIESIEQSLVPQNSISGILPNVLGHYCFELLIFNSIGIQHFKLLAIFYILFIKPHETILIVDQLDTHIVNYMVQYRKLYLNVSLNLICFFSLLIPSQ